LKLAQYIFLHHQHHLAATSLSYEYSQTRLELDWNIKAAETKPTNTKHYVSYCTQCRILRNSFMMLFVAPLSGQL